MNGFFRNTADSKEFQKETPSKVISFLFGGQKERFSPLFTAQVQGERKEERYKPVARIEKACKWESECDKINGILSCGYDGVAAELAAKPDARKPFGDDEVMGPHEDSEDGGFSELNEDYITQNPTPDPVGLGVTASPPVDRECSTNPARNSKIVTVQTEHIRPESAHEFTTDMKNEGNNQTSIVRRPYLLPPLQIDRMSPGIGISAGTYWRRENQRPQPESPRTLSRSYSVLPPIKGTRNYPAHKKLL